MVNENQFNGGWGRAYKCGGIPMYPRKYHFHRDESIEFSEEEVKARKERLSKFLNKYGFDLSIEG